jgi:DNA-binding transcriptional MocR family regulator
MEERGLVEAKPQSGFIVRHAASPRPTPKPRATPENAMPVDVNQRLLRVLQMGIRPGMAPLALALPCGSLMPVAALHRLYASVARRHPKLLETDTHFRLNDSALVRQLMLRSMSWGGPLVEDEIIITNSCTEAIALSLRAVTKHGDTVAVESPGYYLMLQFLESLGLQALEIPTDPRTGMSIDALELATRQGRVAACLLVANASNPLGSIMPDANKRRLARLAAERDFVVVEDDVYGDFHFDEQRPWPIKAFDTSGNVILCTSFSKSLSPSLRIGFAAAGKHKDKLSLYKTMSSGGTNPITQTVLAEYLSSGAYERQIRYLRRTYGRQVSAMHDAVSRYFPAETRLGNPQGGFVLWVELPGEIDTSQLYEKAIAEGVPFIPGELFSPSRMYRNCLRLNCGNPHSSEIEDAVRRLGRVIDRSA